MSIRLVVIAIACMVWSVTAQAAQSNGSMPSGTNYSCDETRTCICDGSYTDCSNMERWCVKGTMGCNPGGRCACTMKDPPARTRGGQTAPRPGTSVRVPPAVRQQ